MYRVNGKEYECAVAISLDIFNDKWKLSIIWHLMDTPKRFKDLDEIICGITKKTLTVKLKELEEKKIIIREVFPEVPPKVVYSLSPTGERLKPALECIYDWGVSYVKEHGEVLDQKVNCDS